MVTEKIPHDASYKAIFSNPDMVKSLLMDFVPEDFIVDFDFSTLESVAASYVSEDLKQRHNDLVWKLKWKGQTCYIYILMEMQRKPDPWMAVRMLAYTALLWQDLINKEVLKTGNPLPPVFPLVIYNGSREWKAARDVRSLLDPTAERMNAYQPNMRYFLLDESSVPQSTLDRATGIAANIIRLNRVSELGEIHQVLEQMRADLADEKYASLKRTLFRWFRVCIAPQLNIVDLPENLSLEEASDMLAERIAQWRENYRAEGLAEGLVKGRNEVLAYQVSTLLEMLSDRFGSSSERVQCKLSQISDIATLGQLTRAVYRVSSLEDFEELMGSLNPSLTN